MFDSLGLSEIAIMLLVFAPFIGIAWFFLSLKKDVSDIKRVQRKDSEIE